jgi:hypothetical protein
VRFSEHKHNLKKDLLERSKLAQQAYEECHVFVWDEARILEIESSNGHLKYKESAHVFE